MLNNGDKVGRFIIEDVLGEGGMGIVYKAHDENLGRPVAVKVLASESGEDGVARVLREARIAAALDHPNAITIHEGGEIDGKPYIVMEFVPGQTLRAYVGDSTPVARKIRWLVDIARALAAAHRMGVVHRDVKPENVMVRPDGKIKVLDFGIARKSAEPVSASAPTARMVAPTVTTKGAVLGTPMYMAPEQVRGKAADGRSDQFSWAVVAYELLEGARPWEAHDALGAVAAMMSEPPRPMQASGVPEGARTVVMRALSRSPAERFGSMDDVVSLLEPYAEGAENANSDGGKPVREKKPGPVTGGRYSTQDLGQAIALALERKAKMEAEGGKYGFDDLTAAAREVGVEEHELRAALASLHPVVAPPKEELDEERRRSKQRLMRHAAMWGVFSVFFFLLDMATAGGQWWFVPALAWGVGVAAQAVAYYFPVTLTPEEKEKKRLEREKRLAKLARKHEEERRKLGVRENKKLRIEEPPRSAIAATDDDAVLEAMAEEEAARRKTRSAKR